MSNFSDLCARVLASRLTLVDVGAAGAPLDVGAVSALCDVHAIEPREDAPVTDEHRFAKLYRHNIGLAGVGGRHRLHITSEPTASSLRRPNIAVAKRYENNSTFDVVAESEIECMTLADFAVKNEIAHIDFIKLDTQGTELEILRGAQGFLDRVSIIRTEVEFVDLYEGQGLFDDIVSELSSRGFRFVDFGEGQRRGPQPGKRIWADATFVRREYPDHQAGLRSAVLLLAMGFIGEGLWLLQDLGLEKQLIEELSIAAQEDRATWLQRLRAINQARRSAGKLALNGQRVKDLTRKGSFGLIE